MVSEIERAAACAIALAKEHGLAEVGADELLLGALQSISRFGAVRLGGILVDLEELGVNWRKPSEKAGGKVGYSQGAVTIFDEAASIAKADGATAMRVEHLLVAFAAVETGLMGELKLRYKVTSGNWRVGIAEYISRLPMTAAEASGETPGVSVGRTGARDYLTPEEAAEALGIHVQTLRGYVRSGKLPALRLAGERSLRIRRSDLETVLEPLQPQ